MPMSRAPRQLFTSWVAHSRPVGSTQSRRIVRRKDASWSLNWPSGANLLARKQNMYFFWFGPRGAGIRRLTSRQKIQGNIYFLWCLCGTRTRTNTNPNDTEANAAGRSGNARALCKQSKCGVYHEGEGHWPKFSQKLQKARHLWVARTPQKQ